MSATHSLLLPVTDEGVVIPREFLEDAVEVVISRENGKVIVKFVTAAERREAPQSPGSIAQNSIWNLGSDPITDDPITDSSVNHDKYLYGAES